MPRVANSLSDMSMKSLPLRRTRWAFGILDILLLPISAIGWGATMVASAMTFSAFMEASDFALVPLFLSLWGVAHPLLLVVMIATLWFTRRSQNVRLAYRLVLANTMIVSPFVVFFSTAGG